MGRKAREYATSEVFKTLFDVEVSKLTNAITKWDLTNHGRYFSTSVGSALTGMGANILTIDDPIKNFDDAMSQTVKDKIWDWFVSTAYTRLEKGGAVLAIMTRWAVDDLVGRLLASDSGWKNITFPMIATRDEKYRKKGEPLWPEKFDLQKCEEIKSTVGRQVWSSLYQQSPVPEGGAIFKEEYFRYYDPNDLHSLYFSAIYQSWDTGVSKKNTSARSSCTTWGVLHNEALPGGSAFYLLDVYANQLNFPELRAKAKELIQAYDPDIVWVEEEQTGRPLIDELRMSVGTKLVPVRPKGQKDARAKAISGIFESGRVFFPTHAQWLADYKEELLSFPFGAYMDNVDSTTQALRQTVKQEYSAGRRKLKQDFPDWMVKPKAPSVFWR
jgi:predicted phage terminase large subunit-like protein